MSTPSNPAPPLSPTLALILGAIITISLGVFAFLSNNFNVDVFYGFLTAYGVAGASLGVYLIQQGSTTPSWLKYVVLIIASSIAYGLSIFTSDNMIQITAIATFVVTLSTFVLDEVQKYASYLPTAIVNDGTLIIGGIVVVASAISKIPSGTTITLQTLLTTAVAAAFVYIIQVYTPSTNTAPTTPAGVVTTPTTPAGDVSK